MKRLRLAARVELGVYHDADTARYDTPGLQVSQIVTGDVFIAYYKDCPSIGFECDEDRSGGGLMTRSYYSAQSRVVNPPAFDPCRWATIALAVTRLRRAVAQRGHMRLCVVEVFLFDEYAFHWLTKLERIFL
jgi:hypothetical protein